MTEIEILVAEFNKSWTICLNKGLEILSTEEDKNKWIDSCKKDAKVFYNTLYKQIFT